MIYYKVRSKKTGLYRLAGIEAKWNKSGKVWDTLGKLRSMITNCMTASNYHNAAKNFNWGNDFSDWEIVEYEVVEKECKSVHEVITAERLVKLLRT